MLCLTQAAISIADAQRRILTHGNPIKTPVQGRGDAYEVTVVDNFYQLSQRFFASRREVAVWERTFPTGQRGRPAAVDVAIFDSAGTSETRIEFGLSTYGKLKSDAQKLWDLTTNTAPPQPVQAATNFVILWDEDSKALSDDNIDDRVKDFKKAATRASAAAMTVSLGLVSAVDLFTELRNTERVAYVAIFEVL
jgi:hypothetical protein